MRDASIPGAETSLVAYSARRAFEASDDVLAGLASLGCLAPLGEELPLEAAAAVIRAAARAGARGDAVAAVLHATVLGRELTADAAAATLADGPWSAAVSGHPGSRWALFLSPDRTTLHEARPQASCADPLGLDLFEVDPTPAAEASGLRTEALVLLSAELLGSAERAFAKALDHLGIRHQFGRPLSSFQTLRHRAARDWIRLRDMEAALAGAAETANLPSARIAKAMASDHAPAIVENALHAHGAMGFTEDVGLGHCLYRVRHAAVRLGTAAELYRGIGREMIKTSQQQEPEE